MRTNDRHQVILDLIAVRPIERQDELARLLAERGFSVTQASVSRDLEKLGIVKHNGRYARDAVRQTGAFGPVSFAESGENLIVVKCRSGLASAAAVRVDSAAIPEIVGTVAGDDTIFIAVKGAREQSRVIKKLRTLLETNEGNGNH